MDFCCSNTCCCSLCTAEQCQLYDQPGKQCRCYNTTSVVCLRSFTRKTESMELPDKVQIFSVLPEQTLIAQVVPMGITEMDIDPLCCALKNCPTWIKCKQSLNAKQDEPALHSIPMPLFIIFCILFAMIIVVTVGVCVAASIYVNDKRRSSDAYDRSGRH
ncbi:unnamed protein product [Litomosoides sigmodontis]|uniref:Uncharacterized protein n=1 Tax=Litomosoides sigmodontis TaxID=42156 RepID=A0A3P7LV73_LITSI|nr:unnamed protein product [Litomosoides sigmodontis]